MSGGRASALYAALGVQNLTGQADLATQYITGLKNQAAQVLGATIGAKLSPIQYNGDFNWYWTDAINFNSLSYNYVSGAVTPSPVSSGTYQIGGAGSLTNLYQQLINGIAWQLSAADNATLQQAMTQSQTQATSMVQAYVSTFGAPTAAQMQAAQQINPSIATPLDYILLYQAGYLWAGKPTPPLSLYAMQSAPNLRTLLQYAPPSAQPILQAMPPYLSALGASTRIWDQQSLGAYTLQQLKNNLLTPSAANGGVTQFNPPSSNYFAGYFSNATPSEILQDLGNKGVSMTMSFSAAASSSSSYNISFSGQAGINWGGDLLDISAGTSFRGDVARQQGAGSTMDITMVYPGVTVVPLFPTAWQQTSGGTTGWWYEPIIFQAWTNFQAGSGVHLPERGTRRHQARFEWVGLPFGSRCIGLPDDHGGIHQRQLQPIFVLAVDPHQRVGQPVRLHSARKHKRGHLHGKCVPIVLALRIHADTDPARARVVRADHPDCQPDRAGAGRGRSSGWARPRPSTSAQ
jgi:hypothetical protein